MEKSQPSAAPASFPARGSKSSLLKEEIQIPDEIVRSWQDIVDTMAEIISAPAALIMKFDPPVAEVFRSSATPGNPFRTGDRTQLTGRFCEAVARRQDRLLVSDARHHDRWKKSPEVKAGMVSYLGFPIRWPDGEIFGTICTLDDKKNEFGVAYEHLVMRLRELAEAHLEMLYRNVADQKELEDILDNLTEGIIAHDRERRILFFNRAAEAITGYSREDLLGKDCHQAFGGPFCGGRCSFQEGPPDQIHEPSYPINILTKEGEPRRVEMNLTGMNDKTGSPVGVIAAFRDVTDLIGLKIRLGEVEGFAGIIGRDPKMLQIYQQIRDLSTNTYPVHITGQTGTGKELVAAAIHDESRRGGGPFVPVNCAALPEGLIESELFGHVKGAFTGAVRDKKGRFELAHGGTIFLDEVADLPKVVQAKLLRVLQEKRFEPVGAEKPITVDVRLISATNRDLKDEVAQGRFRDDLYYRINVVPLHLPPLRDRKTDIPLLLNHFLKAAEEEEQETAGLSKEALALMMGYTWPGNVRELQSALRFALVKCKGRIIEPDHLPMELREWKGDRPLPGPRRKLDAERVQAALTQSGGNRSKAARILGVGRATLYRFLAQFPDVS
jgi:PAS domain S-box-containing protein